MTAKTPVNSTELILLYTGDAYSASYPRIRLVTAICEQIRPPTLVALVEAIFATHDMAQIPEEFHESIENGWKMYLKELKRREGK